MFWNRREPPFVGLGFDPGNRRDKITSLQVNVAAASDSGKIDDRINKGVLFSDPFETW